MAYIKYIIASCKICYHMLFRFSSHNKLENGETGNAQSNFKLPSDNSNVNFAIENSHDAVAVESRSR